MKKMNRIFIASIGVAMMGMSSLYAQTMKVVDIAGRQVEIPKNVQRVILGESRMTYSIAAIHGKNGNPFSKVVAWKDDLEQYDPDAYEKYLAKFPEIAKIKNLGSPYKGDFSIETAIALQTQLVIMNLGNYFKAQETEAIEKLQKAGIATIFVDFRQQPTRNTVPSLLLLGKVFQKQDQVLQLIDFYVEQMQLVYGRVAQKEDSKRPLIFIESAAGYRASSCCSTFGSSNMGRFVELAGGKNWGSEFFGGLRGKINPEMVFSTDPEIIIGTGANWSKASQDTTAVLLGYKANPVDVQKQLSGLANRKGWSTLSAVSTGKFYSIYHQFYNSPYHFVAVQAFAKSFYPDDFRDIDPVATFARFHDQFLPIDYSGVFFARLEK